MSFTQSMGLPIGNQAPKFSLWDTISQCTLSLDDLHGERGTIVMFICNHCPYVIHINDQLVKLAKDYMPRGVAFVAISSNDVDAYPEDAPEHMRRIAKDLGYSFPYLYDESQEVARAYMAACTPEIYVFNDALQLTYHGQLDDSRPSSDIPPTGKDVRMALDAMLQGLPYTGTQKPSVGCSIKWK